MNLSFHNTFPLELHNIANLIAVVNENSFVDNVKIATLTGIGIGVNPQKGKVKPTISYAAYSGLIQIVHKEKKRKIELTPLGELVIKNDPQLQKVTTQWIMHYQLSKFFGEAQAWAFFTHDFLPRHSEFSRTVLENELEEKFGHQIKLKILGPGLLLNSYLERGGFENLQWVREQSRRNYIRTKSYIPSVYVVAYLLAEIWEEQHPENIMISHTKLYESGHLKTSMNLSDREINAWLDELTAYRIIKQLREAPPYQIARQWGTNDRLRFLQEAYDYES